MFRIIKDLVDSQLVLNRIVKELIIATDFNNDLKVSEQETKLEE